MPSEKTQNSFQRGVLSLVILSLLKQGDMYGYQIVQEIERSSGGRIVTKEGSMYPVLYKLLEQGYISDNKMQVGKRLTRIYYHLEKSGEEYLEQLIGEYTAVTQGVFRIIKGDHHDEV